MSNTEKKFDKFFIANLKRTYQMVAPSIKKKEKLMKEIKEKQVEIEQLDKQIETFDSSIKAVTNGYGVEDLIVKEVVTTQSNGKEVKLTKLRLKYPDTVVPPIEQLLVDENNTDVNL